jgi:acetyl-CoA carboxylase biotin carboxylase subunit
MTHDKLLIANRGEIACRIIAAAKTLGLPTVALYSEVDADAPHVLAADEARLIGPAHATESYLKQDAILAVARETNATLVHPGYGFLAENADFAELCAHAGLKFIGPRPDVIRAMGNKERAREIAVGAGVPVVPGVVDLTNDLDALQMQARGIGYPILVKAAGGGGGIGMRLVDNPTQLGPAFEATRLMAERAFGNGAVYLERYLQRARHVEVQVFGFGDGRAVHLFERDCSVQRRHQKVIEEAPAPGLPEPTRTAICAVAVRLASACEYDGAGTVEFLLDDDTGEFFFLEMNTRIQVEHAVTEMITGIDLVAAQIRHAMGEDISRILTQAAIEIDGHAVEARIYAENPARRFMPSPGAIETLCLPEGEGLRIDSGLCEGARVTPYYDPMLMKIVVHGATRAEAIMRLDQALSELVITGIETNTDFIRRVLQHKLFLGGNVHTTFVADRISDLISTS